MTRLPGMEKRNPKGLRERDYYRRLPKLIRECLAVKDSPTSFPEMIQVIPSKLDELQSILALLGIDSGAVGAHGYFHADIYFRHMREEQPDGHR